MAKEIEANDHVLECACGTGAISVCVAPVCQQLVATDFSEPMLEQTKKKCRHLDNVIVQKADITSLPYPDATFDKVIAGNVIHLVKDPYAVLDELLRVCKPNGKVIIPTYIQKKEGKSSFLVKLLETSGAGFERRFDETTYPAFFQQAGFTDVSIDVIQGKMPCAIAIITKP
ncbi:MAG: class I SAM-dependent methyltransferase [Erysipelotrichaceae bacterium]|nr:class I SAM-dependent methyltransferase [Erysipelotrichaceae bacterium]